MKVTKTIATFFFSSRRRHTRFDCDWSSDVCSSDLVKAFTATGKAFTVPPDLVSAVTRRMQQLPEQCRHTLEICALLGRHEIGRASCRERVWTGVHVVL